MWMVIDGWGRACTYVHMSDYIYLSIEAFTDEKYNDKFRAKILTPIIRLFPARIQPCAR